MRRWSRNSMRYTRNTAPTSIPLSWDCAAMSSLQRTFFRIPCWRLWQAPTAFGEAAPWGHGCVLSRKISGTTTLKRLRAGTALRRASARQLHRAVLRTALPTGRLPCGYIIFSTTLRSRTERSLPWEFSRSWNSPT